MAGQLVCGTASRGGHGGRLGPTHPGYHSTRRWSAPARQGRVGRRGAAGAEKRHQKHPRGVQTAKQLDHEEVQLGRKRLDRATTTAVAEPADFLPGGVVCETDAVIGDCTGLRGIG